MGLPVVRNIVELHRGTVEIENKKEGGARATQRLARIAEKKLGRGNLVTDGKFSGRIIAIDDEGNVTVSNKMTERPYDPEFLKKLSDT